MIFKTVLKYKIFEYCIDSIFNKISQIFIKPPITILNPRDLKPGMHLSEIRVFNQVFYECDILNIQKLPNTAIGNIENYALNFYYKNSNSVGCKNPYWTLVATTGGYENDWNFIQ